MHPGSYRRNGESLTFNWKGTCNPSIGRAAKSCLRERASQAGHVSANNSVMVCLGIGQMAPLHIFSRQLIQKTDGEAAEGLTASCVDTAVKRQLYFFCVTFLPGPLHGRLCGWGTAGALHSHPRVPASLPLGFPLPMMGQLCVWS